MKKQIRTQILTRRNQLDPTYVKKSEKDILNNLLFNFNLSNYKTVLVYLDFKNEVKTQQLIQYLLDRNHHVLVPKTKKTSNHMDAVHIHSFNDLVEGNYGIMEPTGEASSLQPDLVIVPGVAFDLHGNRIGFGKGYYDYYFSKLKTVPLKIAFAYDFQIVENIPSDLHDIPVDFIVTENKIIHCE